MKGNTSGALRRRLAGAVVLILSLGVAACGGDDEDAPPGDPGDLEQAGQAGTLTGVSPLTGAQIGDDAPKHPVIVVKIDNTGASAPQVGLDGADLVVEELVEGGSTRLAAFYWEQAPAVVGPVRSMRGTDIGIVQPLGAVLVASGGAPKTVGQVDRAGITTFLEGAEGYSRDGSRTAPYDLMMDVGSLAGTLDEAPPTASYLPFGDAGDLPAGEPASTIDVVFSPGRTTAWRYEKGTGYIRPDSLAEQGDDFVPSNLLVVDVKVGDAGYKDPAGNPVPESKFFGKGDAVLFHEGRAIRATWSKDGRSGALALRTRDGEPLAVPVGQTWIELMPREGGAVTYAR